MSEDGAKSVTKTTPGDFSPPHEFH